MKKILIILVLSLCLYGCSNKEDSINKLMEENEYIIIDVRTKNEYVQSHVVGAVNIPYDKLEEYNELDKDKIIFVYCQSGRHSKIAYETLTKLGYTVYDLGAFEAIDLPKE